jgi:hypothetical protein
MAMGLLPALAVTLVAFCAFTHAFLGKTEMGDWVKLDRRN